MAKEFRIPFDKIADPQSITGVNEREFAKHDCDFSRDPATHEDDHDKGERVIRVKKRPKRVFIFKS